MTVLAATFQPGTAFEPPAVLLEVTAAPVVTPDYVSDFVPDRDGWTGTAPSTGYNVTTGPGGVPLPVPGYFIDIDDADTETQTLTIAGLIVGETYSYSLMAITSGATVALAVAGKATSAFVSAPSRIPLEYQIVATAASHDLQSS